MKYPFPISVIIHKLDETSDPIAHFIQLGNLFEVTLRFLASLTLGSLFHIREKRNIDVPEKVLTGLVKPSLGHWCQVLHSIPKCLGEAGNVPIPEILSLTIPNEQPLELTRSFHEIQIFLGKKNEGVPKKFSLAAFFDLLVAFRNKTKAHGAIQNNLSSEMNPLIEASLQTVLEKLSFLNHYGLAVVGEQKTHQVTFPSPEHGFPAQGELFLLNDSGNPMISLFPMALWTQSDFWFLNGWKDSERIEFLSYSSGKIHQGSCNQIEVLFGNQPNEQVPFFDFGVKFEISPKKVWEIPVDTAIMAQDVCRVFGPIQEIKPLRNIGKKLAKTIEEIERLENKEILGEALLSSRTWCSARFLIEAIIYDLEEHKITSFEIIEKGIENSLAQIGELGISSFAMNLFGAEYDVISCEDFVTLLFRLLERAKVTLRTVERVVFSVSNEKIGKLLGNELAKRLGAPVKFSG